jgi:hypothetical protein
MRALEIKAVIEGVLPVLVERMTEAIDERFKALEIPKGERGEDGAPGEKGEKGDKGEDGKSVSVDDIKALIDEALEGISFEDDLPAPKDGRDALDIEVLPTIDEEKSYPRGTFASHNGGLWRAFQQTQGMKGWECLVVGHGNTRMEKTGPRTMRVVHTDCRGIETVDEYKFPAMIYRGLWKEDETYNAGDVVTRSGAMWHCNKDNPEGKPGDSEDWQLCVKKGRDLR